MSNVNPYKVVLVFNLTKGSADEEIRRSKEVNSFPTLLSQQHGFLGMELVKINEEKTMSVQTWATEKDWWSALETVKHIREKPAVEGTRENILVSRDFLSGYITATIDQQQAGR